MHAHPEKIGLDWLEWLFSFLVSFGMSVCVQIVWLFIISLYHSFFTSLDVLICCSPFVFIRTPQVRDTYKLVVVGWLLMG